MRRIPFYFLVLGLFYTFSISCSRLEAMGQRTDRPYLLLISIDGYRHDYTDRFNPPHLKKFRKSSVHSVGLVPVFPSKTFPNHYTIVTGLYAGGHGIVANSFYDRYSGASFSLRNQAEVQNGRWYGGEPIWIAAKKENVVTATFFWPGSDADIQGTYPTYYREYDEAVSNRARVEQILKWLRLPEDERPHFLSLYFSDVDTAGHKYGPTAKEVGDAVLSIDSEIGYLMDELDKLQTKINVMIVSDHGMQELDPAKVVYLDEYVKPHPELRIVGDGTLAYFYSDNAALLEEVYANLKPVKHLNIHRRSELPVKLQLAASDKAGDLILYMDSPWYLVHERLLPGMNAIKGGTHGYDPYVNPDMQGIFYVKGPQIISNRKIQAFDNVHVYPLMMKLLELPVKTPIHGELKVLGHLLKNQFEL